MEVSIPEAATMLNLSQKTVRRRVANGLLTGTQVAIPGGFTWRIQIDQDQKNHQDQDNHQETTKDEMITLLREELGSRRREVQELHVLLQTAQAALGLTAPKRDRHWWKLWK